MPGVKNKRADSDDEESINEDNIWTAEPPFYVDISAQKAFYKSIHITPPSEQYSTAIVSTQEITEDWKVSMGDSVAIHVYTGSIRRKTSHGLSTEVRNHPFKVQWWCGNIITIYRNLSDDECEEIKAGKKSQLDENTVIYDDYQIEVRWLYREEDIPGFTGPGRKKKILNRTGLEEVIETDDVEEIGANSILGPITLHTTPSPNDDLSLHHQGMPLVHLFNHRFWAVHRRTQYTTAIPDKRQQRGMLFSKYLNRGTQARAAFQVFEGAMDGVAKGAGLDSDWKGRFHRTMSKLTLAEASDDTTSSDVIGRESQKEQIKNFLSSAIKGVNSSQVETTGSSNAFCLFVGGPPGTGKTASVTFTIDQLKKDQGEGSLPEFEFVSLNGMEMQHPFDTYVRLWEAVSNNKDKLSKAKALARLQMYFSEPPLMANTSASGKEETKKRRRPVVLLVDEIDYLVTKKQTILYNLFDWPMTGYENKSDAQLIVIGISNTLNLPERLHVRLQSRIGNQRCIFNSYSWNDSITIIEGRLGEYLSGEKSIFHPDAIRFAARKIASESGDIRKVFQLCKSAAENVFNQLMSGKRKLPTSGAVGTKVIGVGDVQTAAREMFNSILHLAVSHATPYQALLFVSIAALQRNTGRETGGFTIDEVLMKMESMANSLGSRKYIPCPQYHMILGMLCPLGEAGVLKLLSANGRNGAFGASGADTLISLNMDAFEVLSALKDTGHYPLAEKFLSAPLFSFKK